MTVYFITLAMIIFFSLMAVIVNRQQAISINDGSVVWKTNNMFVWISAAILIFVSAFRYYVGSDYGAYYKNAEFYMRRLEENPIYEPGLGIIAMTANMFYKGMGTLIVFSAIITIGLFVRTIAKYSPMFMLSMVLYIFLGFWHGSFNGIRQYLAVAILFAGHRYIIDRKLKYWILVVLIAGLFHTSAYFMLIWYVFDTKEMNKRQVFTLIGLSIAIMFSYDRIFEFIEAYKGKDLAISTYMTNDVNPLRIIVNWVPFTVYMFTRRYQKLSGESNFYINMIFFDALIMTAAMGSAYLARIGIYARCFQLIAWPHLLDNLDEKMKNVLIYIIVVCYFVFWLFDMNRASIVPFTWIFWR